MPSRAKRRRRNPRGATRFDRCVRKVSRRRGRKRVRDARAVCGAALARHRNPRAYGLYIRKSGGKVLKYLGGQKFSEAGKPFRFADLMTARLVLKLLRLQYPELKRYKAHVLAL